MLLTTNHIGKVPVGARRMALAASGFVIGMFVYLAGTASARRSQRLSRKFAAEWRNLADVIRGRNFRAVTYALGPPRTAVVSTAELAGDVATEEERETWYYSLNPRWAMAIQFVRGTAHHVEIFASSPR